MGSLNLKIDDMAAVSNTRTFYYDASRQISGGAYRVPANQHSAAGGVHAVSAAIALNRVAATLAESVNSTATKINVVDGSRFEIGMRIIVGGGIDALGKTKAEIMVITGKAGKSGERELDRVHCAPRKGIRVGSAPRRQTARTRTQRERPRWSSTHLNSTHRVTTSFYPSQTVRT